MDADELRAFARDNHRAVLATRRADGGVQMSPVLVVVDGQGMLVVSSSETTAKVRNLRRNPAATVCLLNDGFFGAWAVAAGRAEVVSLPEAMEGLVDYYRRVSGEHPDWDDYRSAMVREQRVLIRIAIDRAGPTARG